MQTGFGGTAGPGGEPHSLGPPSSVILKRLAAASFCLVLLAGAGCESIGPSTVMRDRLHYSSAVTESWKEQLLLNIVKTRYGDAPAFLEVASVVAGYSLETGVSLNGQFSPESMRGDTFAAGGVSGTYTDRPTISYAPLKGESFARSLLAPVPLDALWSVIQGGTPVDFLLGLTLQSIEGHYNMGLYGGEFQPVEPPFTRVLQLIRALQQVHAADFEIVKQADQREIWVQFELEDPANAVLAENMAELKMLLGIPAETNRVKVIFGTRGTEPGVIAMRTRSLMHMLSTLGTGVQIPPEHLAKGGFVPLIDARPPGGFTVHSGKDKPKEAFVAVTYERAWFWIDWRDLPSKTTLATVTVLFNFLEGGGSKMSPVLTIPTG